MFSFLFSSNPALSWRNGDLVERGQVADPGGRLPQLHPDHAGQAPGPQVQPDDELAQLPLQLHRAAAGGSQQQAGYRMGGP